MKEKSKNYTSHGDRISNHEIIPFFELKLVVQIDSAIWYYFHLLTPATTTLLCTKEKLNLAFSSFLTVGTMNGILIYRSTKLPTQCTSTRLFGIGAADHVPKMAIAFSFSNTTTTIGPEAMYLHRSW